MFGLSKLAWWVALLVVVLVSYVGTWFHGRSYEGTLRDGIAAVEAKERLRLQLLSVEEFSRRETELKRKQAEEVAALLAKLRSYDEYETTIPDGDGCLTDADTRELRKLIAK